jgi:xylulokinase
MNGKYIFTYDIGTSGCKAAVFDLKLNVIGQVSESYPTYYPKEGWAEQDAEDYWRAVKVTTKKLIQETEIRAGDILGIVYDSQANCTVPIDKGGIPLMKCINWLDTRAASVTHLYKKGLIKISGYGLRKLLMFLKITGGAPGLNGKDPISHIIWIKLNKPEIYENTYKFLSAKDYVVYKSTNNATISRGLAHTSWLMNTNPGIFKWSEEILKKFKIDGEKLPEIKDATEIAGNLTPQATNELGLEYSADHKIPIIIGSADLISSAIGSGGLLKNKIHISLGTADWVAAHTNERLRDIMNYTGAITSVRGTYLCISKQETGTACLDWIINHLFKYEAEKYNDKNLIELYQKLDELVSNTTPGSKNLIFTPWMFGERSPLNDPHVRGGFYNLSLEQSRNDVLRAVYEGIAFNIRWALQVVEKLVGKSDQINIIGGGAKSDVWCQILADILQRKINQMEEPSLGSAKGSAIIALLGLNIIEDIKEAIPLIKIKKVYSPNPDNIKVYNSLFNQFLKIYKQNKKMFKSLNP